MLCAIWYHLQNLKNVKNTYEGVILLIKLQLYEKYQYSIGVFHVFKLNKRYQIAQSVTYCVYVLKTNHMPFVNSGYDFIGRHYFGCSDYVVP